MSLTHIFFDLDGTLTDPGIGITNSVMHALRKFGIEVMDRTELYSFIGPPLIESFHDRYGFDEAKGRQAILYYQEYFSTKGIFENEVYPGIPEMLETVKNAGIQLVVATSKPEEYSRRILDHFDLAKYFSFLAGSLPCEVRSKKTEVIAYALEACGIQDRSKVIMVGDRKYDISGAHENGLRAAGVLYGYGSSEELKQAGAEYTASTVEDTGRLLLSL